MLKMRISSCVVAGSLIAGAAAAGASPEPTPAVQTSPTVMPKPRWAGVLITRRPVEALATAAPEPQPAPAIAPAPSATMPAAPAPAATPAPAESNSTHRVYGDVVISRPRWGEPAAPAQTSATDSPLIPVPNNTLGPGLAYWEIREREAADRRLAEAEALSAERDALAPRCEEDCGVYTYGSYGSYFPRRSPIVRGRAPGFRGPFVSNEPEFDDLGAAAQREFTRAATPRIGPAIDAQLQAQRDFNRAATPPVVEVQSRIDRAFIRGQKDLNSPRPAPEAAPRANAPRARQHRRN